MLRRNLNFKQEECYSQCPTNSIAALIGLKQSFLFRTTDRIYTDIIVLVVCT